MAKPARDHVPSIHLARIVRIAATARITHGVYPSTALASASPDIAVRIAAKCVPRTPLGRIARRNAPVRTEPVAHLRTDVATARLVSAILHNF